MSDSDILISCDNVSKRFCRDLKRSLWYGVKDSAADLFGWARRSPATRNSQLATDTPTLRAGEFWANKDISFELRRGECLGLIGRNGAGKTTLLKMLNGLIKPDVGQIEMRGRVGALIALGAGFNPVLTGRENVFANSSILGRTRADTKDAFDDIVSFAEVEDSIDAPVRTYSSGMQVRLGFAIAAQIRPDVMLVDEVLAVGDNAFQKKCYDRIYTMRKHGTSFVVVSHNPYQLERLCDVVAVMSEGEVLKLADPKEAIHLYHTELRKTLPTKTVKLDEFREGTGRARVQSVILIDEQGRHIQDVETGAGFSIRAVCRFKEAMMGVRIRFTIYSDSNTLIANIGSVNVTDEWQFAEGDSVIEFAVDRCDLLAGAYTIEVVVVSSRGERIDRINEACAFSIKTERTDVIDQAAGLGVVHISGTWCGERLDSVVHD